MGVRSIRFYDQNNNTYSVIDTILSYRPMTPEMSSSGTYSGGDPKEITLSKDTYNQILISALELGISVHLHQDKRQMLTSRLVLDFENDRSYRYILSNSELTRDFTKLLQSLLD